MVTTSNVEYTAGGATMVGRLALPEGEDTRAAVLIAHEGGGLDDYQKSRAERFAGLGYVASALDYYGGGKPLTDRDEMAARCEALWNVAERIRALAGAGLEVLLAEPRSDSSRVAAVGYCFGGALVLELARGGTDVKAVGGFHPASPPGDQRTPATSGERCWCAWAPRTRSSRAPNDSPSRRRCVRAGGVDWRMNLYGGAEHSFTRPGSALGDLPGIRYHQPSDERSWRAMLDLFDEVFGQRPM